MKRVGKKSIVLGIAIVGIVLLLCGLFLSFNGTDDKMSSDNKNDDKTSISDKNDTTIIETKYPLIGYYENNDKKLYIYQYDLDYIYFFLSDGMYYNRAKKENDVYKLLRYVEDKEILYTFSLTNNELKLTIDDLIETYTKKSNITEEQFFETRFGSVNLFNSQYNGKYIKDNSIVLMYQYSDQEVQVIIYNDAANIFERCQIIDDSSIQNTGSNNMIKINGNQITVDNGNQIFIGLNGTYQKERNITMQDILQTDIIYYYF